uniref:hypothetical protein n=1 Tax=Edaphochlamys debaryana TaxID=47281 RepID=UPI0022A736B6|nr:hypothetical protein O3567_pgp61 [Edaphochlamys debaryana]UZS90690.1 hypothetical protein [Edaphochlamys debaryana]
MRRGFRKKSRKQRILISPVASTEGVRFTGNLSTKMDVQQNKDVPLTGESPLVLNPTGQGNTLKTINITPPTHSYTVLGKRASRYRHQIYKDVLQHWYYTPFNRLLLKFDVDAFINRQPKTHFLTKNDERVLHIRRFLLSEHYDTLRWYTYMQHYKTMKTNIGGTKSFANRIYNQQFQGTFKKIRHLFAITPKQGDFYTLKFDQPLYNDNNLKDNVYFHEELLTDNYNKKDYLGVLPSMAAAPSKASSEGGRSTSTVDVNSALSQNISRPTGINYSQGEKLDIISQSNFLIANQFLQKNNTSVEATYPASPALSMSKYYASNNLSGTNQGIPVSFTQDKKNNLNNLNFVYNELFVKLIKECKKRIHDQTFLKNYISYRIEKREQLNQEHIKELNKRLEKLKSWLIIEAQQKQNNPVYLDSNTSSVPGLWSTEGKTSLMIEGNSLIDKKNLTTGVQKAVTDSLRQVIKDTPQDSNKGELELVLTKPTYNDLTTAYTLQKENTVFSKLNTINQLTNNITNKQNLIDQIVIINLQNTKKLLYNTINNFKPYLLNKTQLLQARTDKNLQWWRQKQRVTTKRKNSRKRDRFKKQIAVVNKKLKTLSEKVEKEKSNLYKTLYGNYEISDYLLSPSNTESFVSVRTASPLRDVGVDVNSTTLRKKTDNSVFNQGSQIKTSSNLYGGMEQLNSFAAFAQNKSQRETITIWQGFFSKKLRKKISSKGRRYRSLSLARYLTATRKPRFAGLNDLTKIDNITNLQGSFLTKEEKDQNIQLATKNKVSLDSSLKNSQIKKRTRHSWKKRARHQFSRNHYKYRKRHIHGNGKLRVMNKKIKKVKATTELRQWWWSSFLPRYLDNLKKSPITNYTDTTIPPDFKPLSNSDLNKDIALRQDVINTLNSTNEIASSKGDALPPSGWKYPEGVSTMARSASPLGDVEANLPFSANLGQNNPKDPPTKGSQLELNQTTTSVPFYAGWDDSLRKFVVTNRLLSRRDSGLTVNENIFSKAQEQSQTNASLKLAQEPKGQGFASNMVETPLGPSGVTQYYPSNMSSLGDVFTNTPIQGLNEGSFLYWQTDMPFNAYNIDQFITTNQSFYAPLGWRRFEFRHNILKTWINNASTSTSKYNLDALHAKTSINTHKYKTLIVSMKNLHTLKLKNQKQETIKTKKAAARRIKKRYKLLKQMPNQLMYSPTGPLLTEVLPSHYISVFDQQYRFPRNRYLKRNTLKTLKKTTLLALTDSYRVADSQGNLTTSGISKEFTLRKRVKPRRKYHRKRFIKKDGLIFPRRIKFTRPINTLEFSQSSSSLSVNQQDIEENLRWRPSTKTKQKRKETSRSKTKSNKRVKTNPLRLRQLRRREFQQILKPVQRYIPHNGGFAWPGDYLRLEVVDMPKLKTTNVKKTSLKQKINVQPVGIMPRKYLIEKHNILVLKKKLEKAYSSHQLSKVIKEYKILIENQK